MITIPLTALYIAGGVLLLGLVVTFTLGRKWESLHEGNVRLKLRWFINKYEEAEREKGCLLARMNIIRQALGEEL